MNVYYPLTERERKVILAIEQGEPYEAIAQKMKISVQRVAQIERKARDKIEKEDRLNEDHPYII